MHWNFILAAAFMVMLTVIGLYDLYAVFFLPAGQTVSEVVSGWLRAAPVLGIAIGIVLGHLAFPLRFPGDVPPK